MDQEDKRRSVVTRVVTVAPERVFAELTDAWMFTGWVVGASHIRDVDEHWPQVGARLHHTVGPWPLTISDNTEVLEVEPPHRIVLQARAWPVGEARIEIVIEEHPDGALITMSEWPTHGVGRWLRNPLQDAILRSRNRESLARLASIAEGRPAPPTPDL
jgi:uncharacterized protein YndB with AHSA1/START domain